MDPREEIQEKAKQAWLNSNKKSTIILPTGGGKSKVAIDLVKEINPSSVLLLTNSEQLRDVNWKAEFDKFGFDYSKVVSECYQTVYRWKDKSFDFVIADEIDFIAEGYAQFFENNVCKVILGLTGFTTEKKEELINKYAPICFKESIDTMQEAGMLNKSELIFIKFPLSKVKNIEQKKRAGGTFFTSENDLYKYYDKEFQKALVVKSKLEKKYFIEGVDPSSQSDYKAAEWKLRIVAAKRKKILDSLNSSVEVVKELLRIIHSEEGNKVIIFSNLTSQADKFPYPFHGKSPKWFDGVAELNAGNINTLSVVKKLNRGVNLVGVNYSIKESYDGGETDFHQTHGRLMRLRPDQTAKYILLIPQFWDYVRTETGAFKAVIIPTQAQRWVERMLASFKGSSRTIVLDSTLKIKDGEFKGSSTVAAG